MKFWRQNPDIFDLVATSPDGKYASGKYAHDSKNACGAGGHFLPLNTFLLHSSYQI